MSSVHYVLDSKPTDCCSIVLVIQSMPMTYRYMLNLSLGLFCTIIMQVLSCHCSE